MKALNFLQSLFILISIVLVSCSKSPQPIAYGQDACHYCQMTIVDKIHGSEIVTDKGKVFKFDAAECLIRYQNDLENKEGYQLLTNYFEMPEAFVPMGEATFLISENLPSPMGAFLTAFETEAKAIEVQKEKGGDLYNWEELQQQFNQ